MPLDRSGKTASFRFADDIDLVAVGKDIDLDLIADRRFRLVVQANFFQNARRRKPPPVFSKCPRSGFVTFFRLDRLVFDQAELNSVIAVTARCTFSFARQRRAPL